MWPPRHGVSSAVLRSEASETVATQALEFTDFLWPARRATAGEEQRRRPSLLEASARRSSKTSHEAMRTSCELPQPEVQVCSNGSRQRRQICSIVDHILKPNCNAAAGRGRAHNGLFCS